MINKNKYIYMMILGITFLGLLFFIKPCYGDGCNLKNIEIKNNLFEINPDKIIKQLENKEIFLLDIREMSEYKESHILGAQNIPLANLNTETVKDLPHNIPIYIYCRSGRRVIEAENILRDLGFDNIVNMGGIIHWEVKGGLLS